MSVSGLLYTVTAFKRHSLFKSQKDMASQIKIQMYRKDFTTATLLFSIYIPKKDKVKTSGK